MLTPHCWLCFSPHITQAIKLDPTYVRAYNRRGALQFLIKEYHKSLDSYEKVRKRERERHARASVS